MTGLVGPITMISQGIDKYFAPYNYRLQLTARLFLVERPQLKRSVGRTLINDVKGGMPMSDSDSRLKAYVSWLSSEISSGLTYHNHKETMGWTATAGALVVTGAILNSPPSILTINPYIGVAIIIIATIALLCFVNMQFERRSKSADNLEGLRREISRVCSHNSGSILDLPGILSGRVDDFSKLALPINNGAINNIRTGKSVFKAVFKIINPNEWRSIDARLRSEASSYILIIISAGLAVYRVFTDP